MNDWLADFGMFLAQLVSLVVIIVLAVALVARLRGEATDRTRLRLDELNDTRDYRRRRLTVAASEPGARKRLVKGFRREDKARNKSGRKGEAERAIAWVIDFHGDIRASATGRLAQEVSALIDAADKGDEVIVRLESAGGLVHAYGLAAAELDRLRDADIDVEVLTAGRYKRTLSVFGENSEEGREKFVDELESVHDLFKRHVAERRPGLDIEAVATGETWYGRDAMEQGLVDALGTSEAYLMERMNTARVIRLRLEPRRNLADRVGAAVSVGVERALEKGLEVLEQSPLRRR
ncbi:MAG: S49 family peptidase [Halomonas sp.]|nr:S49 family peptidase [Halomonas sp.]